MKSHFDRDTAMPGGAAAGAFSPQENWMKLPRAGASAAITSRTKATLFSCVKLRSGSPESAAAQFCPAQQAARCARISQGIAPDDPYTGKAMLKDVHEAGIGLDEKEAAWRDSGLKQGLASALRDRAPVRR